MTAFRLFVSSFLKPLVYAAAAGAGAVLLGGWARLLGVVAVWNLAVFAIRVIIHRKASAAILANHPAELASAPATEPPDESLVELELQLLELGLVTATPLLVMPMSPPATLRGFVLPGRPVYATAFIANGTELGFDFVSVVDGLRGGLTTSANPRAATLPGSTGTLRQIFPRLTPRELLEKHLEAVAGLEARGVRFARATPDGLLPAMRASMARTRSEFLRQPFTWTQLAIQRVATNAYPDQGPILERAEAAAEIERLAKAA